MPWSKDWPAGFLGQDEADIWLGVPSVGEARVVRGEAEVRRVFRGELEKLMRALRYLRYSHCLLPLPLRTIIWPRSKSTSCTRNRTHSISRSLGVSAVAVGN